jgi:hypothetical protein
MNRPANPVTRRRGALGGLIAAVTLAAAVPALAQGWPWNWGKGWGEPPAPREPVYRPPPGAAPPPYPQGHPPPGSLQQGYPPATAGNRSPICLQLEQRLAQEANRGSQWREVLPRLEGDLRQAERNIQSAQSQLDRMECYEYFLFSKTLRRTRQCVDLADQADSAKRRVSELESQRQQLMASGGRSYQEDIVRELARNNCGATYQQQARQYSPFSSIWQDEDDGGAYGSQFGNLPSGTFRTVCVRLCDGYFFPVSFSTLPNHFDRDADVCQSKCAAPAELFYHPNPGGGLEQAVSHKTRQPYTALKSAFRYRKEYVQGCSCKQAEYVPQPPPAAPTDRRAEAPPPRSAGSQ